jgi:hypothetical protein
MEDNKVEVRRVLARQIGRTLTADEVEMVSDGTDIFCRPSGGNTDAFAIEQPACDAGPADDRVYLRT